MEKEKVLKAVNELPQEVELDILLERLVFLDKVQKGLTQIKEGETVPHDKVVASFREKWQKNDFSRPLLRYAPLRRER